MTADDILDLQGMLLGTASRRLVRSIYHAADDGGVIQARAMVRLFAGRPTLHTTTTVLHALLAAGCVDDPAA